MLHVPEQYIKRHSEESQMFNTTLFSFIVIVCSYVEEHLVFSTAVHHCVSLRVQRELSCELYVQCCTLSSRCSARSMASSQVKLNLRENAVIGPHDLKDLGTSRFLPEFPSLMFSVPLWHSTYSQETVYCVEYTQADLSVSYLLG